MWKGGSRDVHDVWFYVIDYLVSVLNVLVILKSWCEVGWDKVIENSVSKAVTQFFPLMQKVTKV